jgi:hypothetical protein
MALDPSIALNANAPQPANPLATALQVAQFRAYNANGLAAQQQLDANNAASRAFQQSTDANGNTDYNKFRAIMAGGAGAFNLPQINKSILDQQQAEQNLQRGAVGLSNEQLESAKNHLGWAYQTAGAIANNPNATTNDVMSALSTAIQNKQITPQVAAQAIADMPGADSPKGALQQWAANHVAQAAGTAQQLGIMLPKTGSVSTGGGTTMYNQNAITGQVTPTTVFQNTVSPETAAGQYDVVKPDGTVETHSNAERLAQQGLGGILPPQAQPQASGDGRYPQAVQTKPAAGVVDANQKTNAAGGDMLVADQQSNAQSGTRINMLQNAQQALASSDTGQKSEGLQTLRGALVTFGLASQEQANKVASYDEANKYLTQYAQNKAASFGHGTDSQLAAAMTGNGSTKISNLAAQDVVKVNLGLERMEQARMQAWESAGLQPSQYAKWKSQWGSQVDPRVFVADQMDPAKIQGMVKKMNPKEQATFRTQYNWAVQNGFINGPQ